jgi:hypothetical protein
MSTFGRVVVFAVAVLLGAEADAACTAPLGKYASTTSGVSYQTSMSNVDIVGVSLYTASMTFNADHSGTSAVTQQTLGALALQKINLHFAAADNTFDTTTCQGKVVMTVNNTAKKHTLIYTSSQSGAVVTATPIADVASTMSSTVFRFERQ